MPDKARCVKCGGTGWYQYDHNHSTVCPVCCTHSQGWWQLSEHYRYAGYWCCRNGCGTTHLEAPVDGEEKA